MKPRPASVIEWASPEQVEFFQAVTRLARTVTADTRERDPSSTFSRRAWDRCAEVGLHGLPAPEEYGGAGADATTTMLALEALGYGCPDNGLVFTVQAHLWTSVVPVWKFGTEEQRQRWLPGLCSGKLIGCHAATEPEAGSDVYGMSATARAVEGGYVLNGRKVFITNAPVADLLIVFARTSKGIGPIGITAFLVEAGTRGCSVTEMDKMGLRTSPMGEVALEDCLVPSEAVLGRVGRGGEVFQTSMAWERACIMASHVGQMRRTMEACVEYARTRRQGGKPIGKYESVADKIANMKVAVDASRALVLRVGWLMDHGMDATLEAAVAKVFVSEASVRTHLDAVQIHGGYGYMTETEVERALRDAIGGTIYSGTSEIQRRIIARGLGL